MPTSGSIHLAAIRFRSEDRYVHHVTVKWRVVDGNLSIVGEVWRPGRDDIDAGGQLQGSLRSLYDDDLVTRLCDIWDRWHLNTMRAGSPTQEAWIRERKTELLDASKYPSNWYDTVSERLAQAGLNPDPDYLHDGEPYKYGRAWLTEELPDSVVEELTALTAEFARAGGSTRDARGYRGTRRGQADKTADETTDETTADETDK